MPRQITLHDLSNEQLGCMRGADGHLWDTIQRPVREGSWGHRVFKRCARCSKGKIQIFNIFGQEAAAWYETPDWHLKVTVPYDTADVRLEWLTRQRKREAPAQTRGKRRQTTRRLRSVS